MLILFSLQWMTLRSHSSLWLTRCDVITFENEFVNLEALSPLAEQGVCFRPSLQTLAPLLDKYHQRCYSKGVWLCPSLNFVTLEEMGRWGEFQPHSRSWGFQ